MCVCASAHPLSPLKLQCACACETACTSVENMCVSEGVREGEKLTGNIHVHTLEPRGGGFFFSVAASMELCLQEDDSFRMIFFLIAVHGQDVDEEHPPLQTRQYDSHTGKQHNTAGIA